jgi:hypothetical protein
MGVRGEPIMAAIDSAQVKSQIAAMSVCGPQVLQSGIAGAIGMGAIATDAFAGGAAVVTTSVLAKNTAISRRTRMRATIFIYVIYGQVFG